MEYGGDVWEGGDLVRGEFLIVFDCSFNLKKKKRWGWNFIGKRRGILDLKVGKKGLYEEEGEEKKREKEKGVFNVDIFLFLRVKFEGIIFFMWFKEVRKVDKVMFLSFLSRDLWL